MDNGVLRTCLLKSFQEILKWILYFEVVKKQREDEKMIPIKTPQNTCIFIGWFNFEKLKFNCITILYKIIVFFEK